MTINDIKKFASDASTVIEGYQQVISELTAKNEELTKLASAAPKTVEKVVKPELSADLLKKASEAVHVMYGRPANVKPETIAQFWQDKPEAMLSTICKIASERTSSAVTGGETIGKPISKVASAKVADADADFWSKY